MDRIVAASPPVVFCVALAVCGLSIDFAILHGPVAGIFYTLMVLCGLWLSNARMAFVLAAIGALLTLAGHYLYDPQDAAAKNALADRFVIVLELWVVSILVYLHQKAEERHHRRTRQLKLITDNIPALVSFVDRQEKYVFVNKKYEEFFSRPAEQFIGVPMREVSGEDAYNQAKPYLTKVFSGEAASYEYWRDDGQNMPRYLHSSIVPYREENGAVKGFFSLIQDLTENKLIEDILRENQRKYLTLLDNLPGTVYRCKNDRQWTMEFLSDGCLKLTGYPPERFYGVKALSFTDITDEVFREYIWQNVQHALEAKLPFELEYRIVTASGESKWVWEQGVGVFAEDGQLLALEGYITDITERKITEEKLDQMVKELTRSNAELERFAYITSHDLREPLHTIASFAQLLQKDHGLSLSNKGTKFLENILNATHHMRQLIDDLLEFSRLQHRNKPFKIVNCAEVLDYVLMNLRDVVLENSAEVMHDNLPVITADWTQLVQIFQNLLSNALKYHKDKPIRIYVGAERQENAWVFSVKDNGIGIETPYHEQIFGLLKRLHSRSQYPGTGIGLAICQKAVENHGGRIWVESRLDEGAMFFFTIPDGLEAESR